MYLKFNGKDVAGYLGDFSIEDSLENLYISVNFTLPYTVVKKYSLKEGQKIVIDSDDFKFTGVCLKFSDSDNDVCSFMAVDYSWYLSVYEDTVQANGTASSIIKTIINNFDSKFNFKDISDSSFNVKIKKLWYNQSLESIIKEVISEVTSKSGKNFYFINHNNSFKIVQNLGSITLNLKYMTNLSREFDITNIKNQIKVFAASDTKLTSKPVYVKDSTSVSEIGTIQKTLKIKSKSEATAKKEGSNLLKLTKNRSKVVSFTIPGNLKIRSGYTTTINSTEYIIKKIKHDVKSGVFSTEISLEAYYG